MEFVYHFFAGAFLCNCLPHLIAGLQGAPFPSPFAKPSGIGNSSPLVNVLWGFFNLVVGLVLLSLAPFAMKLSLSLFVFLVGFLAIAIFSAVHFGQVMERRRG
ncbi:hypothetical protein [Acidithiobacillus sp. HP-11]|uniref:hypothetical protein n=1 Tax=Acidithiobacillus sp. HP-11 TaxID=2697656 RepID=UPI0018796B74|nr:hypothetical protein [Acidithiobacillus sp. HP-11]MBE7567847.1 hypothetical protein [Acidithiobacillus sp. HP-11]